jgi:hypothetical protein
MIRIHYDTTTGEITDLIIGKINPQHDNPYIEVEKKIKINEWRVNLETLELEQITP